MSAPLPPPKPRACHGVDRRVDASFVRGVTDAQSPGSR
jgi:hypothetical protein